jgi:hypothetical protein
MMTQPKPKANGRCHECGDEVDGKKIYCDACKRDRKALADMYRRGVI